ncbi:MAG: hypothetical protein RLP44_32050 [Aggregatilineales bacterium]
MSIQHPNLHPDLKESFIAISPDPETRLTEEQLQSMFPNKGVWQEMIEITIRKHNIAPDDSEFQDNPNEKSA